MIDDIILGVSRIFGGAFSRTVFSVNIPMQFEALNLICFVKLLFLDLVSDFSVEHLEVHVARTFKVAQEPRNFRLPGVHVVHYQLFFNWFGRVIAPFEFLKDVVDSFASIWWRSTVRSDVHFAIARSNSLTFVEATGAIIFIKINVYSCYERFNFINLLVSLEVVRHWASSFMVPLLSQWWRFQFILNISLLKFVNIFYCFLLYKIYHYSFWL